MKWKIEKIRRQLAIEWCETDRDGQLHFEFCLRCRRVNLNTIRFLGKTEDRTYGAFPQPELCEACTKELEQEITIEQFCPKVVRDSFCNKVQKALEEQLKSEVFRNFDIVNRQKHLIGELSKLVYDLIKKCRDEEDDED